jgi:hypothetical protein
MLQAIRRVISGEDIEETQRQDPPPSPQQPNVDAISTTPTPNAFLVDAGTPIIMQSPVALIETSEDDNVTVNDAIGLNNNNDNDNNNYDNNNNNDTAMDVDVNPDGDSSTAGSSLSDVSAAKEPSFITQHQHLSTTLIPPQTMRMVVEEESRPPIPSSTAAITRISGGVGGLASIPQPRLARNDSRNSNDSYSSYGRQSSQNSSRDWGWFEDVHTTSLDHPANSGGDGATASSGNLKRSKDHSNINHSQEENNNQKKGKKGRSGGDTDEIGDNNDFRSGGGREKNNRGGKSGGGSPLFPNLGLLYAGGDYSWGGDSLYQYQPLEPLRHQATAMDMESGKFSLTNNTHNSDQNKQLVRSAVLPSRRAAFYRV